MDTVWGEYMKRPEIIRAAKLTEENKEEILKWVIENAPSERNMSTTAFENGVAFKFFFASLGPNKETLYIRNRSSLMYTRAYLGDYIVQDENKMFSVCPAVVFEKTYHH